MFELGTFKVPDLGDEGGERNVVEDPARTAEYRTERTVVIIPTKRVPVVTTFDLFRPLHS